MQTEQTLWTAGRKWQPSPPGQLSDKAQLALIFGSRPLLEQGGKLAEIRAAYPKALLVGCSTAGEICATRVEDDSLVCTAVHFEKSQVQGASIAIPCPEESFIAGADLGRKLPTSDLVHVLVFSDGLHVNGSDLVRGLSSQLPEGVIATGGLSGDGALFEKTLTIFDQQIEERQAVAIGLYGKQLRLGYGSQGGWDPFGPDRVITRSKGNVLYSLDGRPALELYKRYLGKQADGLPAAGLLFPLSLRFEGRDERLVRTILAVNEDEQSMTFAGDVPEGAYAQLMKANFDRLIDGAVHAARRSETSIGAFPADLALLISCVGRKMILKQRIEEEVEGVQDVLGSNVCMTGFYSYGEISPQVECGPCKLHNQTMTITVLAEK